MRIAATVTIACLLPLGVAPGATEQKPTPGSGKSPAKTKSGSKAKSKSGPRGKAAKSRPATGSKAASASKSSGTRGKTSAARTQSSSKNAQTARHGKNTRAKTAQSWRRSGQLAPTPERYREIQTALAEKGYLKESPTGVWNAGSADALRRFQQDQNLEVTGKLNSLSLIALGLGAKHNGAVTPGTGSAAPGGTSVPGLKAQPAANSDTPRPSDPASPAPGSPAPEPSNIPPE